MNQRCTFFSFRSAELRRVVGYLLEPVVLTALYTLLTCHMDVWPIACASLGMRYLQVHLPRPVCRALSAFLVFLMLLGVPDSFLGLTEKYSSLDWTSCSVILAAAFQPSYPSSDEESIGRQDGEAGVDDEGEVPEGEGHESFGNLTNDLQELMESEENGLDPEEAGPAAFVAEEEEGRHEEGQEEPPEEDDEEDEEEIRECDQAHQHDAGDQQAQRHDAGAAPARNQEGRRRQGHDAGGGAIEADTPEVKRWFKNYFKAKDEAEKDPSVLDETLPEMKFAVASSRPGGSRPQATQQASIHASEDRMDTIACILQTWKPTGFQIGLDTDSTEFSFTPELEAPVGSMADEMSELRVRIDRTFGWYGRKLDSKRARRRAAAQATLLLLEASPDDARSEILHTKLFTLLQGEFYASHGGVLFQYSSGAMVPSNHGTISSASLELMPSAIRRAQAYYLVMARDKKKPARTFDAVSWQVRVIQSLDDDQTILDWQLNDIFGRKAETKAKLWFYALSELCRDLRRQFGEHNKKIVSAFHRWAESDLEKVQQAGVAFKDVYMSTRDGRIRQLPKDPRHGCYVSVDH